MVFASYDRLMTAQHLYLRDPERSKRVSERLQGAFYESKMFVQDLSGLSELSWVFLPSLGLLFGALLGCPGGVLGALQGASWGFLRALWARLGFF